MEPTPEVKAKLIEAELQAYTNTEYQLELRARIARKLEDKEGEKRITEELVRVAKAIDFLNEVMKEGVA